MVLPLILLGILGMAAQAVYLREILATFSSGEFAIGIILAGWLLWTALGSGLAGRFIRKHPDQTRLFHLILPWYGLAGYMGVFTINRIPALLGLVPGELVPLDVQVITAVTVLAPVTVLGGVLFTIGARALSPPATPYAGRAYIFEAVGAALGGILVSIAAVLSVPNILIAGICVLIACMAAGANHVRNRYLPGFVHVFLVVLAGFLLWNIANEDISSQSTEQLLAIRDTRYHRLKVTQTAEQITFYANTSVLFSTPDPERTEFSVHLPLLAQGNPRSVLIIGGGPGGMIDDVLRYPALERIVCVELDPAVFALTDAFLGTDWHSDPRIELAVADGRAYLNSTSERFDAIILNLPPPLSACANRYYTREFYSLLAGHLTEDGIAGLTVEGAENYIPATLASYLAIVRTTLSSVFPSVAMLPGDPCHVLLSSRPGSFDTLSWQEFESARIQLGVEPSYVRDYYLRYLFSQERTVALDEAINNVPSPGLNTDTAPFVFIQRTMLQGELDGSHFIDVLNQLIDSRTLGFLLVITVIVCCSIAAVPGKSVIRRSLGMTVVVVGMTEISLELLAIFAYQSVFGLLYARIALLIGAYMAGLAAGAAFGERVAEHGNLSLRLLGSIQVSIAIVPLLWIGLLTGRSIFAGIPEILELGFYLLAALSGLLGGLQFPVADRRFRVSPHVRPVGAGFVYALDLAGSAAGALVFLSVLIPALGMVSSLILLAILNGILGSLLLVRSDE